MQVIQLVFSFLTPVAISAVILSGFVVYKLVVDHLPAQQRANVNQVMTWAESVVHSVEQSMPLATGADKKATAVSDLVAIANAVGLHVPAALIETAIEAAVYALNEWHAYELKPPAPTSAQTIVSDSK